MRIHITRFPSSAAFAVGAFLGLLVCALFTREQVLNDHNQYLQDYGQSLANMAARQAIDATFNHDLVRLQVILQDTLEHPRVFVATLHDVENNLLVQAGQAKPNLSPQVSYTSAVVLQDSVAGYLSIGMDASTPNNKPLTILFFGSEALLLFIALSLLIKKGGIRLSSNTINDESTEDRDDILNAEENNDELEPNKVSFIDEVDIPPLELEDQQVCANFYIENHALLEQQLSKDTYAAIMQYLETIIIKVSTLYNAEYYKLSESSCQIFFKYSSEQIDADFRAVCSAILVRSLSKVINHIPLELTSFVTNDQAASIDCSSEFGIVIDKSLVVGENSLQKIIMQDISSAQFTLADGTIQHTEICELLGLIAPYDKLVEKQSKQMQIILNSAP